MRALESKHKTRTLLVVIHRGDYVIEVLRGLFQEMDISTALITSGIGSLDICNLHTITCTSVPSKDQYFTLQGPIEVGSLQGSVAGGEPHIHVVVHDTANDRMHVGHLEEGTRCCYRMELGLIVFDGIKTENRHDSETQLVDILPVDF